MSAPEGNGNPSLDSFVSAGIPVNITWDPVTRGTVSLVLLRGTPSNLRKIQTIASGIVNDGGYSWTPDLSLSPGDNYAISLVDDLNPNSLVNFSPLFAIDSPAVVETTIVPSRTITEFSMVSSTPVSVNSIVSSATDILSSTTASVTSTIDLSPLVSTTLLPPPVTATRSKASPTLVPTGRTSSSHVGNTPSSDRPSPSGGLSTGAKAGIGAGAALGALLLLFIAFIFWRRRRNREAQPLAVIGNEDYEKAGNEAGSRLSLTPKPELAGTEAGEKSRFALPPKPELATDGTNKAVKVLSRVAEVEHHETVPELEHGSRKPELSSSRDAHGVSVVVPSEPDLYPTPQTREATAAEETEFEAQARRLRERRALIAEQRRVAEEQKRVAEEEQEHIDMEEKALRRKRGGDGGMGL